MSGFYSETASAVAAWVECPRCGALVPEGYEACPYCLAALGQYRKIWTKGAFRCVSAKGKFKYLLISLRPADLPSLRPGEARSLGGVWRLEAPNARADEGSEGCGDLRSPRKPGHEIPATGGSREVPHGHKGPRCPSGTERRGDDP